MAPPILIRITPSKLDPEAEATSLRRANLDAGAIVSFTGQVRGEQGAVTALTLEHYPRFTERAIEALALEAADRWRLSGITIIHRIGIIQPGDPIVFVAAAAAHRRDAFQAVDFLMDRLKSDAPFWKLESHADGARWVEPRLEDFESKARWAKKEKAGDARRR